MSWRKAFLRFLQQRDNTGKGFFAAYSRLVSLPVPDLKWALENLREEKQQAESLFHWTPWVAAAVAVIAAGIAGWELGLIWSKASQKERSTQKPTWADGERPLPGESGRDFADRVLDKRYGKGNYKKGPGSEHNWLKKWGDRGARMGATGFFTEDENMCHLFDPATQR